MQKARGIAASGPVRGDSNSVFDRHCEAGPVLGVVVGKGPQTAAAAADANEGDSGHRALAVS